MRRRAFISCEWHLSQGILRAPICASLSDRVIEKRRDRPARTDR
ncbi:hypothetical protein OCAR_7128 [Afipia carboxidovorans OM5]|nr:hypothetical protein OCAR_7128 [Afipia carboxidovorans OM5]